MTLPPKNEELAVTQADRDAAALALGYKDWDDATDYRLSGAQDRIRDHMVQAFARHRLSSTPSPDPAKVGGEELLAHFKAMQAACSNYLEPTTYIARHPDTSAIGDCSWVREFPMPDPNASSHGAAETDERRDKAFIRDMIYMLDGPEQRAAEAALSSPVMPVGGAAAELRDFIANGLRMWCEATPDIDLSHGMRRDAAEHILSQTWPAALRALLPSEIPNHG